MVILQINFVAEDDCIGFWNRLQDMAGIDRIIPEEPQ
jgi:hypothetical protein